MTAMSPQLKQVPMMRFNLSPITLLTVLLACSGVACSDGGAVAGPSEGTVDSGVDPAKDTATNTADAGPTTDTGSKQDTAVGVDIPVTVDAGSPDLGPNGCTSSADCADMTGVGPCQFGVCDNSNNQCVVALKGDGTACDDGSACTAEDACKLGQCAGTDKVCDDGDACTEDDCDSKTGTCGTTGVDLCQCETDVDCADEEDGDLCNGTLICAKSDKGNTCVVDPKTVVSCNTADDTACLKTSCSAKSGECLPKPADEGGKCDDGSVCTPDDACNKGLCVGAGSLDCDDKNGCTADSCDPASGCVNKANTAACDDGDACTTADACVSGKCVGTGAEVDCNDDNDCTDDGCDAQAGCVNKANQAGCDDGSECTKDDKCAGGKCIPGLSNCGCEADADCAKFDDGDACNGVLVCDKSAQPFACKVKVDSEVTCDASKDSACLKNKCDSKTGGCGYVPAKDGAGCDDNNKCTVGESCASGLCSASKTPNCDDGNPCTTDACDKAKGCVNTSGTGGCDDGNACTINDKCADSKCNGGAALNCVDGTPCTKDSCEPAKGCVNLAIPGACDDGDPCTSGEACKGGECATGAKTDCGDDNPCTDDTCDPKGGCVNKANAAACDDKNACTKDDVCKAGGCTPGAKVVCDDKNACTNDVCDSADAAKPCKYVPNTSVCDDGSKCTVIDACKDGKCQGNQALNCADGEVCTKDICDADKGCLNLPQSVTCTDGAVCTDKDACKDGKCQGTATNCDDGNGCTVDSCDASKGCVHINAGQKCDDGDPCTGNDSCIDAKCVAGAAVPFCCKKDLDCDDKVICTVDKCSDNTCTNVTTGETLASQDFEGELTGWTFTADNNNGVKWQKVSSKSAGGKASLYMGNVGKKDYDGGDTVVVAKMPKFVVPMGTVTLSVNVWSDLEDSDDQFDVLSIMVNGAIYDEVYSSTKGWKVIQFDLTPVQGQEAEVAFEFATGDEESNKGEGVYIDNVIIKSSTCGGGDCKTHTDCSDLNDCTGDLCVGGKCQHSPAPSHTYLHEDFDDVTGAGAAQGWALTSTSATTTWSISSKRARSGKQSLYAGDPKTSTYGKGKAEAKLPKLWIPVFGNVTLVTHVWMDVKDGACDKDRIRILAGGANKVLATSCVSTGGKWVMVSANLTEFLGLYVTPIIEFDTVDDTNNGGEGVYLDDVSVVHERACIDLDEDFEETVAFNFNMVSDSASVYWHTTTHNKYEGVRSLQAANPANHTYNGGATTTSVNTGFPVCAGGVLQFRLLNKLAESGCDKDAFRVLLGNVQLLERCTPSSSWEAISIPVDKYAGTSIPISFEFKSNGSTNNANGPYIDLIEVVCP